VTSPFIGGEKGTCKKNPSIIFEAKSGSFNEREEDFASYFFLTKGVL
jgi:hypothetical protein